MNGWPTVDGGAPAGRSPLVTHVPVDGLPEYETEAER